MSKNAKNAWTHTKLQDDLYQSQISTVERRVVIKEFTLGKCIGAAKHPGRVDVMCCRCAYNRMDSTIYEVKASRSDFLGDVNKGKFKRYFDYCNRFYFATPSGLIQKEEVPEGAGLITRGDRGWHVVKAAKRLGNPEFSMDVLQAMMFNAHYTTEENRRLSRANSIRELVDRDADLLEYGKYLLPEEYQRRLRTADTSIWVLQSYRTGLKKALGIDESVTISDSALLGRAESAMTMGKHLEKSAQLATVLRSVAHIISGENRWPIPRSAMEAMLEVFPGIRDFIKESKDEEAVKSE